AIARLRHLALTGHDFLTSREQASLHILHADHRRKRVARLDRLVANRDIGRRYMLLFATLQLALLSTGATITNQVSNEEGAERTQYEPDFSEHGDRRPNANQHRKSDTDHRGKDGVASLDLAMKNCDCNREASNQVEPQAERGNEQIESTGRRYAAAKQGCDQEKARHRGREVEDHCQSEFDDPAGAGCE